MNPAKNVKLSIEDLNLNKNNNTNSNQNKYQLNSIIYTKVNIDKSKNNLYTHINKIKNDINNNNNNKFSKNHNQNLSINEFKTNTENVKKTIHNKNYSKKRIETKKSQIILKSNSKVKDNLNIIKNNDLINRSPLINYNSPIKLRKNDKKSPNQKPISNNKLYFLLRSPQPYNFKDKSQRNNDINFNQDEIEDYFLLINNRYKNYNKKRRVSNNTEFKRKTNKYMYIPKAINNKRTLINNDHTVIDVPLYRSTSFDSKKYGINQQNIKIFSGTENSKREINNLKYIRERNQINNINYDFLPFKKKFLFTESNTNYNSNISSYNNTLNAKKKLNKNRDLNKKKEKNYYKATSIQKSKSYLEKNAKECKVIEPKIERKKLSFDIFDNNTNKNINKDILRKIRTKMHSKNNSNLSGLIIRFENKKLKNYFKNNKEDNQNNEDNCNQFLAENEQVSKTGINLVKINNFIINKPKEENLKYSSVKEFIDEIDDKQEINPSQISKIIIGQIEGYKDIIEDDKNININDKSKSLLELLSKYSFSNINYNNNKHSILNSDYFNLFEDSNEIKGINEYNNSNKSNKSISKNMSSGNMPNLTNIKNVDEEYDSEDLSISIFKNNIKSINTNSKAFLDNIYRNNSNDNRKYKNNFNYKNCFKNSMNTNNTTISSGNNAYNNKNMKAYKDLNNINEKNKKIDKMDKIDKKNNNYKKPNISKGKYNLIPISNSNKNRSKDKKKNISNINKKENKIINLKNNNSAKIVKNIEEKTRILNNIKSNSNIINNSNINSIFNSNKKNEKKLNDFIYPLNTLTDQDNGIVEIQELKEDNSSNIIKSQKTSLRTSNNNTINIYNVENETIINAYFNDLENEGIDQINENEQIHKNEKQCNII